MIDFTPVLRLYAKYRTARLSSLEPVATQETELLKLINRARSTQFGQEHSFAEIRSVKDYQARVPLRYYEDFWTNYWKAAFPKLENLTWPGVIPFFPVSSGTSSGKTKYLPCTRETLDSNKWATFDMLVYHLTNRPESRVFGGKSFFLGGSADLVEEASGIFSGDLSGISIKTMPFWAKKLSFPSLELALLKDWEEKIVRFAEGSLKEDIRMISGVPAWMLILFNKLKELLPNSDGKLRDFFPNLELIIHGGVNFTPYHHQFKELLDGSRAELREVYPASEGFIASADRDFGQGMRLSIDTGIFFEFVPLEELQSKNPTRHWIADVQTDLNYAIILTTNSGLWSYVLGDTVKFVELNPPRLLVTGRTSYSLSAFGEHLIGEEIEDAVSLAAAKIGYDVTDYSVGAIFPSSPSELGGHLYFIEFAERLLDASKLETFAQTLDARLSERNEDYAAHRANGFGLKAPLVKPVVPGTFAAWMKSRGKLGGQHKVPRVINDQNLFADLKRFAGLNK